jgi:hypothetical protein
MKMTRVVGTNCELAWDFKFSSKSTGMPGAAHFSANQGRFPTIFHPPQPYASRRGWAWNCRLSIDDFRLQCVVILSIDSLGVAHDGHNLDEEDDCPILSSWSPPFGAKNLGGSRGAHDRSEPRGFFAQKAGSE